MNKIMLFKHYILYCHKFKNILKIQNKNLKSFINTRIQKIVNRDYHYNHNSRISSTMPILISLANNLFHLIKKNAIVKAICKGKQSRICLMVNES